MDRDYYDEINYSPGSNAYSFNSEGSKGVIPKIVVFQTLGEPDHYNLFLSDFINGQIQGDDVITDNGDIGKVMGTIVQIVNDFTEKFPSYRIIINGSDQTRKRLYGRIIFNNYRDFSKYYDIEYSNGSGFDFEPYIPTDKNFIPFAFRIARK